MEEAEGLVASMLEIMEADECSAAASRGDLAELQRLKSRGYPWDEWVCSLAASSGHLEVLQWARAQDPPCPWSSLVCVYAVKGGHSSVLQWALTQSPPCPWSKWVCAAAAEEGDLATLQWLVAAGCPWDPAECLTRARMYGHAAVDAWVSYCVAPDDQKEPATD